VKTPLGETAAQRRTDEDQGPYASYNAAVADVATSYTTGALGMLACTPEAVAKTVEKALSGDGRPRARYRVAPSAGLFMTTRKLLPDAAFDALLRSRMPAPTRAE
jgi:hypothetical protein